MERGSEIRGTALASKGQVPPRLRRDAHSLQLCRTHSSSAALRTQPGACDTSRSCSFWSAREQNPEVRTNGEGEASLQVTWGQQLLMRQSVLSFFLSEFHLCIYGCSGSSLLTRGLSLVVATLVAVRGLLIAVASLVAEHGL